MVRTCASCATASACHRCCGACGESRERYLGCADGGDREKRVSTCVMAGLRKSKPERRWGRRSASRESVETRAEAWVCARIATSTYPCCIPLPDVPVRVEKTARCGGRALKRTHGLGSALGNRFWVIVWVFRPRKAHFFDTGPRRFPPWKSAKRPRNRIIHKVAVVQTATRVGCVTCWGCAFWFCEATK